MEINDKLLNNFATLSPNLWWTMLIDVNHQNIGGPGCYEAREPGYLSSMFSALDFMLSSVNEPLSVDYLIKLHSKAIGQTRYQYIVSTESGLQNYEEPFTKGLRDHTGTEFGLVSHVPDSNCSFAGFIALLNKLRQGDGYFSIQFRENGSDGHVVRAISAANVDEIPNTHAEHQRLFEEAAKHSVTLSIPLCSHEKLTRRMTRIIAGYHRDIASAASEDDKLRVIATCVHELELTHGFYDGNGRTNMLLLLNKLLLQNNLSPCMLKYADRFDAYSIAELCEDIRVGQQRYLSREINDQVAGVILHLDNNPLLRKLVAYQIAAIIPIWHDVDKATQVAVVSKIDASLESMSRLSFTVLQLSSVVSRYSKALTASRTSLNPVKVDLKGFERRLQEQQLLPLSRNCVSEAMAFLSWGSSVFTRSNLSQEKSAVESSHQLIV